MPYFSPEKGSSQKLYYEILNKEAKKLPLLLCHCWTGNLNFYRPVIPLLPKDRPYILVDLPGHGQSGLHPPYNPIHFAALLANLLDNLHFSKALIGGHSLGGMTALAFASRNPKNTKALLLFHTTASLRSFLGQREGSFLAYWAMFFTPKMLWGIGIALTAFHPFTGIQKRVRTARSCLATPRRVTLHTLKGIRAFDGRDHLSRLTMPSLILVGGADTYTDIRHALFLHRKLKNSSLKILPKAGHMGTLESPESFAKAVSSFLEKCP